MSDIATHSFGRIHCVVAGVPIVDFWEGNEVIKVSKNVDAVNYLVGADGKALVSINLDESAIIELQLKPSSPSNTFLQALLFQFRRSLRPASQILAITDFSTAELKTSPCCVVMNEPTDTSYGTDASVRTWRLFAGKLDTVTIGQL